jgi:hypothetical protein
MERAKVQSDAGCLRKSENPYLVGDVDIQIDVPTPEVNPIDLLDPSLNVRLADLLEDTSFLEQAVPVSAPDPVYALPFPDLAQVVPGPLEDTLELSQPQHLAPCPPIKAEVSTQTEAWPVLEELEALKKEVASTNQTVQSMEKSMGAMLGVMGNMFQLLQAQKKSRSQPH